MAFKVGDTVKIIDEKAEGLVISVKSNGLFTVLVDGFEFDYHLTDLLKVTSDKQTIHKANEKAFDYLLQSSSEKKKSPQREFDIIPTTNRVGVPEIDLHIHELVEKPQLLSNSEMMIIQIQKLEQFIQHCMEKSVREFVVIHGVGEGVLKQEIRLILQSHGNIEFQDADYSEYGFGATHAKIKGLFKK